MFNEMGKEWARLFADRKITKILTVEASGIGIACVAAQHFHVPVVFAKKSQSVILTVKYIPPRSNPLRTREYMT